MNYTITIKQDIYTLQNDGADLTYIVQKMTNCVDYTTISAAPIAVLSGASSDIVFTGDGEYRLVIVDGIDPDENVDIQYYLQLLDSLIINVFDSICDCGCGCTDCTDLNGGECCNLLMTRAKIDAYKRLVNPEGVAIFDVIYAETKCLVKQPVYCAIAEELIRGEASCNTELVKQMIALDYLAIYFYKLSLAITQEDIDFVKDKFETNKIFCCIQKLGIDVGSIETKINA